MEGSDYPVCRRAVPAETPWTEVRRLLADSGRARAAGPELPSRWSELGLPPFLFDLGKVESRAEDALATPLHLPPAALSVNPSLSVVEVSWKNLPAFFDPPAGERTASPLPGPERVLVWKEPGTGVVRVSPGRDGDLLALKIVVEELDPLEIARDNGVPVGAIDRAVDEAAARGILLRPSSRIRREGNTFPREGFPDEQRVATVFTLQWHVTQECDLSCRHCYDRSRRSSLPPERGMAILHDLRSFCRERFVAGQVTFTGGNPFLYEHFDLLYSKTAEAGLAAAVAGNPVSRARLEGILAIRKPSFFQVSLEGLPAHNDAIRGNGNFRSVMDFLDLLRECGVFSIVMLTLTDGNVDQVLPLARLLTDRADRFAFNRLSAAGRGKDLAPVDPKRFQAFLRAYLDEAARNPVLGRKDNLLNLVHRERGEPFFGGCTGYGCGAAFNFVSLLSDGEVHACRKFPSPIGRIGRRSLAEIYDSRQARKYREGAKECGGCAIRPVCGGCLAVTHSSGRNVFIDRDPYCFLAERS